MHRDFVRIIVLSCLLSSNLHAQDALQDDLLVQFKEGSRAPAILLSDGKDGAGAPKSKSENAKSGHYFWIIDCTLNLEKWRKERIDFLDKDGVNIQNSEIVLETDNGRKLNPTYASYLPDATSGDRKFAQGPLRNVALLPSKDVLRIYVARTGKAKNQVEAESGGELNPNLKAFRLSFAFLVPSGTAVKTVSFVPKRGR